MFTENFQALSEGEYTDKVRGSFLEISGSSDIENTDKV
jgi:hypothetical protein